MVRPGGVNSKMKSALVALFILLSCSLACKRAGETLPNEPNKRQKKEDPVSPDMDVIVPMISVNASVDIKSLRQVIPEADHLRSLILGSHIPDWKRLVMAFQKYRHLWSTLDGLSFTEAEANFVLDRLCVLKPRLISGLLSISKVFDESVSRPYSFMGQVVVALTRSVEGLHQLLSRGFIPLCLDHFDLYCQHELGLTDHMEAVKEQPRRLWPLLMTMKIAVEAMIAQEKTETGFPVQLLGTLCFMSAKNLAQQPLDGIFSASVSALLEQYLEEFFDCLGDAELRTLCEAPTIHSPFSRVLIRCLVRRSDNVPELFNDLGLDLLQILAHYDYDALGISAVGVVKIADLELSDLFDRMKV